MASSRVSRSSVSSLFFLPYLWHDSRDVTSAEGRAGRAGLQVAAPTRKSEGGPPVGFASGDLLGSDV